MTDWLINGNPAGAVPVADRGLAYGDGVFETLVVDHGDPPWWRLHWRRLERSCRQLDLPVPDQGQLLHDVATVAAGERCVVKVIVSRGPGGRGYRPPARPEATVIVQGFGLPPIESAPLRVGVAEVLLGQQPALAGLKHLNRLEQVLVQKEIVASGWDDALTCDSAGWLIEGAQANVFLLRGERCFTPRLDRAGVRGVFRDWLSEQRPVEELRISPAALTAFDGAFLANSVRGVRAIDEVIGHAQFDRKVVDRFAASLNLPDHLRGRLG